jgi:hypothetical protein
MMAQSKYAAFTEETNLRKIMGLKEKLQNAT